MATLKALIIGGGGGGGKGATRQGGGGGAGGYQQNDSVSVGVGSYPIVVGNGGSGATTATAGQNGFASLAFGITSIGGGGGAGSVGQTGESGGSGGGGSGTTTSGNTDGGVGSLGHDGGTGFGSSTANSRSGGGGGGSGAIGVAGSSATGGTGGAGTASSISGSPVTRGGGGGGNGTTPGSGGAGGGGAGGGTTTDGVAGTANTGGGGGGADSAHNGGAGGSGVVVISYITADFLALGWVVTGGTITTDGANTVHTFNSSGSFLIRDTAVLTGQVKALVIAGGGGGGSGNTSQGNAGGGGGGGYQEFDLLITAQDYAVVVGNGGSGAGSGSDDRGTSGDNSSALDLISIGGGGGAGAADRGGLNGGSGGGGSGTDSGNNGFGSATTGQGFDGGSGHNNGTGSARAGGGGGGAGALGVSASSSTGGTGGAGKSSTISGGAVTRGGGGGGAGSTPGAGGSGGGGGENTAGTANTGGGGGGADQDHAGGAGGSGVVIISYNTSAMAALGFIITGGTITTSGGNTIHTFNSSGTFHVAAPFLLTTFTSTDVTKNSATGNADLVHDGDEIISERGFVWSTSPSPTTADDKVIVAGTTGPYSGGLTGLLTGTLYYVRAYAITDVTTHYGNEVSFTTLYPIDVDTFAATAIEKESATGNGEVHNPDGETILERGFVWDITPNPTIADDSVIVAGTDGVFAGEMTGLDEGTIYFYRAYCLTADGYSYGESITFTTQDAMARIGAMDEGFDDFGEPIYFELIDRWRAYTDMYAKVKSISGLNMYTENAGGTRVYFQAQKSPPNVWQDMGTITEQNNALFPSAQTEDFDVGRLRYAGFSKGTPVVFHSMEILSINDKGFNQN